MENKSYRNNGTIGALLDEYEKALAELIDIIRPLSNAELIKTRDATTKDPDCHSIQTVLSHVVQSGYTYVIEMKRHDGETVNYRKKLMLDNASLYIKALDEMFNYNVQYFEGKSNDELEEQESSKKILARWGQRYDIGQMMEHAIVHVLRHRRQIKRFLLQ